MKGRRFYVGIRSSSSSERNWEKVLEFEWSWRDGCRGGGGGNNHDCIISNAYTHMGIAKLMMNPDWPTFAIGYAILVLLLGLLFWYSLVEFRLAWLTEHSTGRKLFDASSTTWVACVFIKKSIVGSPSTQLNSGALFPSIHIMLSLSLSLS